MKNYDDKIIPTLDDVIKPGDLDKAAGDLSSFDDSMEDGEDDAIELFTDSATELDDTFDNEFDKLYAGASNPADATELDEVLLEPADDEIILQPETIIDETDTPATDTPVVEPAENSAEAALEISVEDIDSLDDDMLTTDISALEEAPENFQVASEVENTPAENVLDDENYNDNHDDLADLIVAESFPHNDAALHASIEDDAHDIELTNSAKPRTAESPSVQAAASPATASTIDAVAAETTPDKPEPVTPGTESTTTIDADINVGALVDDITKKLMPEIEWKIRMRLREVLDEIFPEK
ncbi:MAG: hypothetical protein WBN96_12205 [Gammaproteobacteria bacterium]